MGKYDFIKLGNFLYWHDPDSGLSNGVYQVASIPENIEEDSVILIASDTSEAEVFPSELSPTGRSHKEDFLRWKTEREAEDYSGKVPHFQPAEAHRHRQGPGPAQDRPVRGEGR